MPDSLLRKMRGRQTEVEKLGDIWQKIVGQDLAEHSAPASYQNEVLTVFVDNANWASKLRHSLPAITKQCRKQENLSSLNKVKIKIGLKSNAVKTIINSVPKTSRISKASAALILESAKYIEDETLKASLERLGGNAMKGYTRNNKNN